MSLETAKAHYAIGYRDALAVVCMVARLKNPKAVIHEAAEALLKLDPGHCHAKAILAQPDEGT